MSVKTVTAAAAFLGVQKHAEKIKNDDSHTIEVMDIGDAWPQGDILIMRIGLRPSDAELVKNPSAQLAPGTSQGSRHTLASLATACLYKRRDATELDGPIIVSESAAITVEHPEHGNVTLPAGIYAITYQRAFADELRRVQD